jgi:DNA repair protein RecO (recombination protein O)
MNQEAVYILNRREYKESSLLLDVISPNYGRLSIIANGALKSKKGWSAMLQVFQPLLMIWTGKSSLKTLVSVDAPSKSLSLHGRRLFSAYYLNELLVKLLPQDHAIFNNTPALFINYAKSLEDLVTTKELEIPLRVFEYHLLSDLGVLPDLSYDTDGHLIEIDRWYQFIPHRGFSLTSQSSLKNNSPQAGNFLGKHLIKLADFSTVMYSDKEFMLQIKRLMRILIQDLLGGQELKSRALFQTYQPFRSSK